MDPADSDALRQTLAGQDGLLRKHDQILGSLMDNSATVTTQVRDLSTQLSDITTQLAQLQAISTSSAAQPPTPAVAPPTPAVQPGVAAGSPPPLGREPHIADPEPYSGDPLKCKPFIMQCSLVLGQKPLTYSSEESRIQYIIGLLRGRALDWATALWEGSPGLFSSCSEFVGEFKKVFDHSVQTREAASQLLSLRQGSRSVADYSIDFRVLAASSGWNDFALRGAFFKGLSEQLKDELAVRDETATLDSLISLAVKLDNRLRERRREKGNQPPVNRSLPPLTGFRPPEPFTPRQPPQVFKTPPEHEPMQLGRTRLTPEERFKRMSSKECLYCGQKGHFIASCPQRPKA